MSYNGWSNRATWLVNVWYNPESKADVEYAREDLESAVAELGGILQDLIDLSEIDWDELMEHFEDDEEETEDDANE